MGEQLASEAPAAGQGGVKAAFEQLAAAEEDSHYEEHVKHSNPVRR